MTLSPGSKLGPYEILSAIGSGGMGSVYKAKDTRLGLTVVIRKVKEQHSERFKQEAVRLTNQIAIALEAAHKKGIIHRELKPRNIMVTEEGTVNPLEFGLAKLYEQDASISSAPTAEFPGTQAGADPRNRGLHVTLAGTGPACGCTVGGVHV